MKLDVEKHDKKPQRVPLEEALNATGFGKYTIYLFLIGGFAHFSADCGVQIMSFILPAASCDLKLTGSQKGLLASMATTGMMTSAHLCGVLADVYGRRKVILVSLCLQTCICIVSSLAPDALTLLICWFIFGNVGAGIFTPVLVYISEFCPQHARTKAMIVTIAFGALAEAYLASVAWLIIPLDISIELLGGLIFNSWRLYLAALSVPTIISMFFLLKLPESPKFLLNQGKKEETLHILQDIYAKNNNDSKENYPISNIELDLEDKLVQGDLESGRSFMKFLKSMINQTAILFNRTFLGYTLLSCVVLLGIGAAYMNVIFWIPDQVSHILRYSESHNNTAGVCEIVSFYLTSTEDKVLENSCEVNNQLYILAILLGFAQLVSSILTTLVADRLNNKLLLGIILITPGLLCILIIYIQQSYLIIGSLITASAITAGAYAVALSYVLRYFPTSIRSNAASVTMAVGRIGISGLSLILGILLESNCDSAYWTLGATFIGSALFCIILPPKRKLKANMLGKQKKINRLSRPPVS